MQRMKTDESEVLEAFFEAAYRSGMLERKAELLYPDFDISARKPSEIEQITAVASYEHSLYGLTNSDMIGEAHPDGSVKLDVPGDKGLATVETVTDRAKKMREVAERSPTGKVAAAVAQLLAVADLLDSNGMTVFARNVDSLMAKLAEDAVVGPPTEAEWKADIDAHNKPPPKSIDIRLPIAPTPIGDADKSRARSVSKSPRRSTPEEVAAYNNYALALLNEIKGSEGDAKLFTLNGSFTTDARLYAAMKGVKTWSGWGELFAKLEHALKNHSKGDKHASRSIISGLVSIANSLDAAGLRKYAGALDACILSLASNEYADKATSATQEAVRIYTQFIKHKADKADDAPRDRLQKDVDRANRPHKEAKALMDRGFEVANSMLISLGNLGNVDDTPSERHHEYMLDISGSWSEVRNFLKEVKGQPMIPLDFQAALSNAAMWTEKLLREDAPMPSAVTHVEDAGESRAKEKPGAVSHYNNNNEAIDLLNKVIAVRHGSQFAPDGQKFPLDGKWTQRHTNAAKAFEVEKWSSWGDLFSQLETALANENAGDVIDSKEV